MKKDFGTSKSHSYYSNKVFKVSDFYEIEITFLAMNLLMYHKKHLYSMFISSVFTVYNGLIRSSIQNFVTIRFNFFVQNKILKMSDLGSNVTHVTRVAFGPHVRV